MSSETVMWSTSSQTEGAPGIVVVEPAPATAAMLGHVHPEHHLAALATSLVGEGYIDGDTYKPATQLLHQLIDVVSKNGNLLLNVGPRGDGSIPDAARDILLEMGAWLKVNGEAIYGSRPWTTFGEGPTEVVGGTFQDREAKPYTPQDFRFTTHGATLYAIALGWPEPADHGSEYLIRSLAPSALRGAIARVTLLADGSSVPFTQGVDGLHLRVPRTPVGRHAYVFRIESR